jgi:hypothetical protein
MSRDHLERIIAAWSGTNDLYIWLQNRGYLAANMYRDYMASICDGLGLANDLQKQFNILSKDCFFKDEIDYSSYGAIGSYLAEDNDSSCMITARINYEITRRKFEECRNLGFLEMGRSLKKEIEIYYRKWCLGLGFAEIKHEHNYNEVITYEKKKDDILSYGVSLNLKELEQNNFTTKIETYVISGSFKRAVDFRNLYFGAFEYDVTVSTEETKLGRIRILPQDEFVLLGQKVIIELFDAALKSIP